jgi:outer membrane protein OmpA-like peptidoglycan-associated protein
VAGADTAAAATANGLRVTFGKDVTDLSPAIADQIKALLQSVPDSGTGTAETKSFEVVAYATGTPSDPSTARRLSLSRALAVRSVLLADGVPSARIYVRALGSQSGAPQSGASEPRGSLSGDAPADRVDLTVLGGNAGAKTQAQ